MQRNHYNTTFIKKLFPIIIIADNITNAANIGSLFRTADAFGVEKLYLCGDNIKFTRRSSKTSRATEKVVPYKLHKSTIEVVNVYRNLDYHIIALEITTQSKSIQTFNFLKNKPIALVIGAENQGISESVLDTCDAVIHINMYGQNSSMNVIQATTICLFEFTKQLENL